MDSTEHNLSIAAFGSIQAVARRREFERYISALFCSEPLRSDLMVLAAFTGELTAIGQQVSEPGLGSIRLQWWRDGLDSVAEGYMTGVPIADALGLLIKRYPDIFDILRGIIDTHQKDFVDKPYIDKDALYAHLDASEGAQFLITARLAGIPTSLASHSAIAAGRAYGLSRLLAQLSRCLEWGRNPLPIALLARHGIAGQDLMENRSELGLIETAATLIADAQAALSEVQQALLGLENNQMFVFLPLAPVGARLMKQRELRGRLATEPGELSRFSRLTRISWGALLGRV